MARLAVACPVGRWPAPVIEFSIWTGDLRNLALSPDGRRLAYVDSQRLFLRDVADRVPREVVGDGEVRAAVWSPAGDELAVEIGERLWRVPIGGGQRRPICDLPKLTGVPRAAAIAGTWLRNDTLLFGAWRGGIYKVAATGGTPELLIPIDPKVEVDFHFVEALPDGESLLLAAHRLGGSSNPVGTMSIELYRKGRRTAIALDNRVGDMLPVGYSQGLLLTIQGRRRPIVQYGRFHSTSSSGRSLASRRSSSLGPSTPSSVPTEPWHTSRSATAPGSS